MGSNSARRDAYMSVPIPTYEEATSRPSSSQCFRGATEISNDAERQRSFNDDAGLHNMLQQPTVESVRDSLESHASDLSIPDMMHDEQLNRRQLEELDYMEPGTEEANHRPYHRARLRNKISRQLGNISATLGAIRMPSLRQLYTRVPVTADGGGTERSGSWRSRLGDALRIPEQYRMSMPTFARLCALVTIAAFIWLLFALNLFPRRHMMAVMYDPEQIKAFIQDNIDGLSIAEHLRHLSSYAHEAGSEGSYFMLQWMKTVWETSCQFDDVALTSYEVLATYPVVQDRHVKVINPADQQWTAVLEEDHQDVSRLQTLAWHAHSANGQVEGPLIYANGGSRADFRDLHDRGIITNGTIALVQNEVYPSSTGLKVHFAQEAGCVGVLVFNSDSFGRGSDTQTWPDGALPRSDSLHRANVALPNWVLGDPLTPGIASKAGARKHHEMAALALPKIPSLPVAWRDASVLLERLRGHGETLPSHWFNLGDIDVYTGNGSTSDGHVGDLPVVEISNHNDVVESQPIWNLHATINGMDGSRMKVYVGAPRDSWCFGATESASSSAVLTEVVNIFGALRKQGWRPQRNVEFVSWDAKTLNSAGSAEFVEDNIDFLRDEGVAYVNIEQALTGSTFAAAGSPLLQRALQHALNRVTLDGNQTLLSQFDANDDRQIDDMSFCSASSGSAPFAHIAGIPTIDLHITNVQSLFVQGSCYNTAQWLESYGDPFGNGGSLKALASVWALVILDLISSPLLPMDVRTYAVTFGEQAAAFEEQVNDFVEQAGAKTSVTDLGIDFELLHDAVESLKQDADSFHEFEHEWTTHVTAMGGMEDMYMNAQRIVWNERLIRFEKSLIDTQQHKDDGRKGGLRDRPQFKNVLYAPEKWSDGIQTFAMVWDYLEEQQWEQAGRELNRIASIVQEAGKALIAD